MTRWNLVIPEETDRNVRSYLARTGGKKGDLSRFVNRAVHSEILRETLHQVWERNEDLSAEQAQALADEAVTLARANRS